MTVDHRDFTIVRTYPYTPEQVPIVVEKAHCDATPVHAGLGNAKTCDLRVSFPGGRSVVAHGIAANAQVLADLTSGRIRPK